MPNQPESTNIENFGEVSKSLHEIAYWLRFNVLNGDVFSSMTLGEKCAVLNGAGIDNKTISSILSISEDSVRGHLSHARNKSS